MRRALNGAFAFAMVVVCGANPPGCECITDNTAIDFEQRKQLGWSYGTWCAAWDDGVCTPEANGKDWAPKHSCSSENPGGCEKYMPDLDWYKPQLKCCDAWCYVDPKTCNSSHWGIDVQHSIFTENDLWFSYGDNSLIGEAEVLRLGSEYGEWFVFPSRLPAHCCLLQCFNPGDKHAHENILTRDLHEVLHARQDLRLAEKEARLIQSDCLRQ
eukprot:3742161-Rhodomonas_salina.1